MTASWVSPRPAVTSSGDYPPAPPLPKVKVLHIITRLQAGAGGNTLLSAIGMERTRYDMWIAAAADSPLWQRAEECGVRTVHVDGLKREISPAADVRAFMQIVRLIRRERFTVIHAHSAKAGFLGRLAGALCRVPVVVYSLHGRDPWWPSPAGNQSQLTDVMSGRGLGLFLFLERALRLATHRFVAVSPSVARDAVVARIATPGKVDVAASAVDLDEIPTDSDDDMRRELGLPADATVVGTVGRLDAQKAPLDFVRAAAIVAARRPDVRFVMVGEGEQRDEAAALARELGVDVLFTGHRTDAPRIASVFDVFVVTSLYEGVGRSVTEAMASGRPVVATAVDGVVDIVAAGSTGLLAAPRDPVGLAERVCWLLDHPVEAAMMGDQARELVRELFSAEHMCAVLDAVYSSLLGLEPVHQAPESLADRLLEGMLR